MGALLADFAVAEADARRSVTWAVVHDDPEDITHPLRRMITCKLHRWLSEDEDLAPGARFLDGAEEPTTAATLTAALAAERPGLVVTSSHGKNGPLGTPQMAAELGLPVQATIEEASQPGRGRVRGLLGGGQPPAREPTDRGDHSGLMTLACGSGSAPPLRDDQVASRGKYSRPRERRSSTLLTTRIRDDTVARASRACSARR